MLKLPENLSALLAFDPATLAVTGREGKRREFKLDYFQKDIHSKQLEALRAFGSKAVIAQVDANFKPADAVAHPSE